MNNQKFIEEFISSFSKKGSTQSKVFELLADQKWHCRSCEGKKIASEQYAGGGGIQGLQRGTNNRPGLVIESKDDFCPICQKKTRWDRWTGNTKSANAPASIPVKLIDKILRYYDYTDVIEQRKRAKHELVIDHRFPMIRWENTEETLDVNLSETEIQTKFQLLKKDDSGNHNLLKSRSCENCFNTGKRGKPFGISFWYDGQENWSNNIPKTGTEAEKGCIGCGWYNFEKWRNALNKKLNNS